MQLQKNSLNPLTLRSRVKNVHSFLNRICFDLKKACDRICHHHIFHQLSKQDSAEISPLYSKIFDNESPLFEYFCNSILQRTASYNRKLLPTLPPLLLHSTPTPIQDHTKFLELYFDQHLRWTIHIRNLKAKYFKTINVLNYLANPEIGCNRQRLLHLYKALLQAQPDYGSVLGEKQKHTQYIKYVRSYTIGRPQICSGAHRKSSRKSPSLRIYADVGISPLSYRHCTLHITDSLFAFPR